VRVHPNATTPAHALLKFGSVFEVDRFGRRVDVHTVPSLAALTPTLTHGARTAGAASYTWVKLRYGMPQLGLNVTAFSCAVAAQGSIAMEAASRAQLAQAAQRVQLEALAAAGAVVGAAGGGVGQGGGGVPVGAGSGGLPGYSLPPGYAALQGRAGMPMPSGAAGMPAQGPMPAAMGAPVSYLPRSPVYATAPINVYGKRRLQQYASSSPARPTYANWGPAPAATAQQMPAGYGGAVGGAALGAAAAAPFSGAGVGSSATYDPTAEGYLTLTFYTGFANATAFPYGKGNAISAPGNGLKWSLEIANWPFCSFDHTLALELDVSTTRQGTAMGQWTAGSEDAAPLARAQAAQAAGRGPAASVMVNDAFAAPIAKKRRRRDLKQAGLGAYLSYLGEDGDAAALAGGTGRRAGAGGRAGGRAGAAAAAYGTTRVAKLLMNDTGSVELAFPTYAFESPIGARAVNVSILLDSALAPASSASAGGGKAAPSAPASFTFGFPYFQTIYYDPTVSFGDTTGMPISDLAQLPAGCSDVSCLGGAAAAPVRVAGRRAAGDGAKNGAGGGGRAGRGGAAAAAAAALLSALVAAM